MRPTGAAAPPEFLPGTGEDRAGSYLVFQLGPEDFAFPAVKVREIMARKTSRDLSGKRLPLVDLRLKFGIPGSGHTGRTCVIVLEIDGNGSSRRMGMVVDGVTEVLYLTEADIETIPYAGAGAPHCAYLCGMTRQNGKLRTILNVDRVLGGPEADPGSAWLQ